LKARHPSPSFPYAVVAVGAAEAVFVPTTSLMSTGRME
jgi:hypothetical protein